MYKRQSVLFVMQLIALFVQNRKDQEISGGSSPASVYSIRTGIHQKVQDVYKRQARALLKKPKILILDDSTSAVDTATDAKIREAFAKKIPGTTKLIIAQRISSVQDADRILVMENGRINGFDTHENLLRQNEIYREICQAQMKGGGDFDQTDDTGKERT